MNATQKKIQGAGKVVAILTKIAYITAIVVVFISLTGIVWNMLSPESGSFMAGPIRVVSPVAFAAEHGIAASLFTTVASQLFFIAILIHANRIFRIIGHEYSPFLPQVVKGMRKIAILLLLSDLISPFVEIGIAKSMVLTPSDSGNDYQMIILAVIVYCFSLIFQYGAELQQQSDETL